VNSPDCLLILLRISVFLLFTFSFFHFLVVGFRAVDLADCQVLSAR